MLQKVAQKRMPVERGVPKGPPRQQVPQSVQECAVKKDPWFQIGTASGQIGCYIVTKCYTKKGSRPKNGRRGAGAKIGRGELLNGAGGQWDTCPHITGVSPEFFRKSRESAKNPRGPYLTRVSRSREVIPYQVMGWELSGIYSIRSPG